MEVQRWGHKRTDNNENSSAKWLRPSSKRVVADLDFLKIR